MARFKSASPTAEDVSVLFLRLMGGRSYREVSDAGGGKPHYSRLWQIVRDGAVKPGKIRAETGLPMSELRNDLDPETVLACAEIFGVDPYVIRDAVAVSLGYPPRATSDPTLVAKMRALKGVDLLTPSDCDPLVAMASSLIAAKRR